MPEKVFVTGIGIVSSIGFDAEETASSLQALKSGIGSLTILDSRYKDEIPVAEVKADNNELKARVGVSDRRAFSRSSLLGIIAARQALMNAHISDLNTARTGLISASTGGGMDRTENFWLKFRMDKSRGRLRDIISHDCADSTEKIAAFLGIVDYVTTISTACSSSANAILVGTRLIENGILDRVLVGGVDALSLFTLNGFNSLMILDRSGCKPFDNERNGLTLGEGAGFLMLESERSVSNEGKPVLCSVTGYGNACEAFHQTASSPEGDGALLSMQKALSKAGITPAGIDYINAHGTGTINNDLSEGKAIERLCSGLVPPVSSTKSFTGHTLGAAGAIEAILCVMALKRQWIYPNMNFRSQMEELNFSPVTVFRKNQPVINILSNSFGFGGNNTSLIFTAC